MRRVPMVLRRTDRSDHSRCISVSVDEGFRRGVYLRLRYVYVARPDAMSDRLLKQLEFLRTLAQCRQGVGQGVERFNSDSMRRYVFGTSEAQASPLDFSSSPLLLGVFV